MWTEEADSWTEKTWNIFRENWPINDTGEWLPVDYETSPDSFPSGDCQTNINWGYYTVVSSPSALPSHCWFHMSWKLWCQGSFVLFFILICIQCPGGGDPPPLELPLLPSSYMAQMMMNLQVMVMMMMMMMVMVIICAQTFSHRGFSNTVLPPTCQ